MTEQKNIIVVFTKKTDSILSDIEKKYNLEESDEEAVKKMEEDKPFRTNIIVELARNFVMGIISEKELTISLQKELNVFQQTAEKISKNIINDLVPSLKKIPEDQLNKYSFENEEQQTKNYDIFPNIKPPIELENILRERQPIEKNIKIEKIAEINKSLEKEEKDAGISTSAITTIKKEIEKDNKNPTKQSAKPDVYREPIE